MLVMNCATSSSVTFITKSEASQTAKQRATMVLTIEDVILVSNGESEQLLVTVKGPPVAQPRMRVRRLPRRVVLFDPSSAEKKALKIMIKNELVALGVPQFPLFTANTSLKIAVVFYVANINKDIDNMLKFVLDVFQGSVYSNDKAICSVNAQKIHSIDGYEHTEITIENYGLLHAV